MSPTGRTMPWPREWAGANSEFTNHWSGKDPVPEVVPLGPLTLEVEGKSERTSVPGLSVFVVVKAAPRRVEEC